MVTKYSDPVKVLAPVFVFSFPYMAYLTAELFSVSSILAIVVCGIVMKQYVKSNISYEAMCSVKYFVRVSALCSETVIFMFLGLSCVSFDHKIDWWFIGITIAACTFYRTIFVIFQCTILNRFKKQNFTAKDQFIISYSGLRGAIAFGLAVSIPTTIVARNMFITTTIAVVFFTVVFQGVTVKPILLFLNVETKKERELRLVEDLYNTYFDHTISGIEIIVGQQGMNSMREKYARLNAKFIQPQLIKEFKNAPTDTDHIIRACIKVAMQDASEWAETIRKGGELHPIRSSSYGPESLDFCEKNWGRKSKMKPEVQIQKETELYNIVNELLDKKLKEMKNTILKEGKIPMITQGYDIADNFLIERQRSRASGLNNRNIAENSFMRRPNILAVHSQPILALQDQPDSRAASYDIIP
uniref:Sodium/hydrogen exchanger n=1 Tax=Panagrolaimus sp. JU765 TaxID=591449 RepID=A0AC34QPS9_9BILA